MIELWMLFIASGAAMLAIVTQPALRYRRKPARPLNLPLARLRRRPSRTRRQNRPTRAGSSRLRTVAD